ncbi:carbohydrate sulfotransferase 3-like isoform X2 [Ruditapes philippinarum]|uniref:carbohydrate sulfotransferase 3-like isoform X2 n=1 Tax=Ruditapes philippinarum TaxID=129788 RepID=UPI00295BA672|nr:carbohydrate sulfotransferase 3-like isoform X2 [Ruditapes philippinarum]
MAVLSKKTVLPVIGILLTCLLITFYEVQNVLNISKIPTVSIRMNRTEQLTRGDGRLQSTSQFPKMVLVLTYMRSGSSLTGDILQQSSEAFYVYEPFRAIESRNSSTYTISYVNGTKRKPPFSLTQEAVDGLYNWFTCNISRLPVIGLFDSFLNIGIKTRAMQPCLQKVYNKTKSRESAIKVCTKHLEEICKDSPVRIVKTIRMAVNDVKHLLKELPTLKIVHLVRDPRATLYSQYHFGMCKQQRGGWQWCANNLCKRLENDVLKLESLKIKYPDRILNVLYKDIAKDPLTMSRKMYDFIGEDFTRQAESYIYNITMAGNQNNCAICTTRSNSSEHINTWKKKMNQEFLQIVNERCNYILKRLNFDVFPASQL